MQAVPSRFQICLHARGIGNREYCCVTHDTDQIQGRTFLPPSWAQRPNFPCSTSPELDFDRRYLRYDIRRISRFSFCPRFQGTTEAEQPARRFHVRGTHRFHVVLHSFCVFFFFREHAVRVCVAFHGSVWWHTYTHRHINTQRQIKSSVVSHFAQWPRIREGSTVLSCLGAGGLLQIAESQGS